MRKALRRQRTSMAPHIVPPTPERAQHGAIAEVPAPFADAAGAPSAPWRAIDILAALDKREAITAGDAPGRRALPGAIPGRPSRPAPRCGYGSRADRSQRGPRSQWRRRKCARFGLERRAGPRRPGVAVGIMPWHVIGWEMSLTRWALEVSWGRRRPSDRRRQPAC